MAFKMKKFSGFKTVGENIKKVSKKVATKVATDKIKKQLVKRGLKTAAKAIPIISAATTAYGVGKTLQKKEVGQKAVENIKKKGSSRSQFLVKI